MPPHRIKAVVGLHSMSEYNELKTNGTNSIETSAPYEITFQNIVVHPEYSCLRPYNDIGNLISVHVISIDHYNVYGQLLISFQIVSLFSFCLARNCHMKLSNTAMLEISESISFSKTVRPICIASNVHAKAHTYDEEMAIIAGWGHMNETIDIGMKLLNANCVFFCVSKAQ